MKAIYREATLCVVIEDDGESVLLEPVDGTIDNRFWVDYSSPNLILDPTDEEVDKANDVDVT